MQPGRDIDLIFGMHWLFGCHGFDTPQGKRLKAEKAGKGAGVEHPRGKAERLQTGSCILGTTMTMMSVQVVAALGSCSKIGASRAT